MKILITGVAGFIGSAVAERLLAQGETVIGLDNLNSYYEVTLKRARLNKIIHDKNFRFLELDIANRPDISNLFLRERFDRVIHLAAQAGVRHSINHPNEYVDSNLVGFINILEGCRTIQCQHLVYASSSSVYGNNTSVPFSEEDQVDHPISLYAATKKANELMAHSYSHLFNLPTTGLRFFTVYGPWGRPDMATFLFTKAIINGSPIKVFNHGNMYRDFTYIDDIVEGVVRVLGKVATPLLTSAPYRIFNIGNNKPVALLDFIAHLESALGLVAKKQLMPMQDGDVPSTYADTESLKQWVGFSPSTSVEQGIRRFVGWYRDYYSL